MTGPGGQPAAEPPSIADSTIRWNYLTNELKDIDRDLELLGKIEELQDFQRRQISALMRRKAGVYFKMAGIQFDLALAIWAGDTPKK